VDPTFVTCVVITHDRRESLRRSLESIWRQTWSPLETIVVLNGAEPETMASLENTGHETRVVILDRNRGVPGGRNEGFRLARGEVIVFLDDDAVLEGSDAVTRVLAHFREDQNLAALGLLVVRSEDGAVERACVPYRHKRVPRGPEPACYFAGGACAVRRRAFQTAGLYDESLFYFAEELDLAYRMLEGGWTIRFDPTIRVVHHSAPGGRARRLAYFTARNRPLVALRHLPLRYCLSQCVAWWGWSLVAGLRSGDLAASLRGIRDCLRGMPAAWRGRRVLSAPTMRLLRARGGRLCY
jgi:GT2 family glycosyltransferase